MKVFNWVHRRFLNVHSYTASSQDNNNNGVEKDVRSKVDVDTHALLEHGGHHVVVDWKEGILAIGTLAIGPLETTQCEIEEFDDDHHHYHYHDDHDHEENNHALDDDDDDDDDDSEASPLMNNVELFSHELEKIDGAIITKEMEEIGEDECQIRRRVTLADLFSADSDHHHHHHHHHHHLVEEYLEEAYNNDGGNDGNIIAKPSLKMKSASRSKNGLSKAKKLLKEELRPLKKLNEFMKRMMKRKIHPEMRKKDIQMQPTSKGVATNQLDGANDLASLLLIQGALG